MQFNIRLKLNFLGNDGIEHALFETEASCVFCSHETLPKLATVSEKCSKYLKNIVVMSSQIHKKFDASKVAQSIQVRSYEDLSEIGAKRVLADDVTINPPKADDCAIIMYTSGSTGKPKGITYLNFYYNILLMWYPILRIFKYFFSSKVLCLAIVT